MPDVPKRCPKCGAPYREFFSRAHRYYCDSWVEPETGTDTEAERWRKQYEALRAGVEQVARDLNARTYIHRQLLSHYHDGAADAYEEAEQWVRHLLSEAGGGSQ